MANRTYTFIDLFAGCGGLSEGFLATGRYEALAHIEWEKPMVDTLRNRLVQRWGHTIEEAQQRVIQFDIQKTEELVEGNWSEESIRDFGQFNHPSVIKNGLDGLIKGRKVDLIIGGPPCQAYSIHGRATDKNSMQEDYRNYLFESFCKIVAIYKPEIFVFENVAGLLSAKPGGIPVRNRIYDAFTKIGYDIISPAEMPNVLFEAGDYNVPQHRPRVIILGVKKGSDLKLSDLYDSIKNAAHKGKQPTVKDAIFKLPALLPLTEPIKNGRIRKSHTDNPDKSITFHDARNHSLRDREIFREWVAGNMNHISHKDMIDYYYKKTGHKTLFQKYKSLEWDKPAHTIVAHLSKDGYMFIHPDVKQERSITIREAACLMTFPMDYQFLGSTPYNYRMIGNAVPVNFASGIATGLYRELDKKHKKPMNILIACEESQAICSAFRARGHNAYSCDILECSGGHPEWHFKQDVLKVIPEHGGRLETGEEYFLPEGEKWDLMIAHPPCTYLSVSGARWLYHPDDAHLPVEQRREHPHHIGRRQMQKEAIEFFLEFTKTDIEHWAIENPVGCMNSLYRKADQIVQPFWFGDEASKKTCLWLHNLPKLTPTKMVDPGARVVLSSGRSLPKWYSDSFNTKISTEERRKLRSKTFPGFADAVADQWGKYLEEL